jgi:alanyl-tRNA synthetase
VIRTLSSSYPELLEKEAYIQAIINEEEKAFAALLPRGLKYLNELLTAEEQKNFDSKQISGRHAFYLYDTLGFPIDLTQLILEEKGYVVDMNAFEELMQEQKRTSKEKSPAKRTNNESHFSTVSIGIDQIAALQSANIPPTNDEWKYIDPVSSPLSLTPKIQAIVTHSGELVLSPSALPLENELIHCGIILDQTSFFSESGGQISDIGTLQIPLSSDGKSLTLHVIDVQVCGPYVIHTCTQSSLPTHLSGTSSSIDLDPTAPVKCHVDYSRRLAISSNHTMTHILNYALRRVLSPNSTLAIDQKGSLVTEEKLRFDFSYSKPLLKNEVEEIESIINNLIRDRLEVNTNSTSLSNISDINGLRAVFGETYPDPVRVVSIGSTIEDILSNPSRTEWLNFSIELCGGNHLKNTSEAILFRIIEEISSARGVRRISAVTGDKALQVQSESQKLKQMIANEQKCLTSSPLTASELSKSSVKLLKFHDLLTSQTIPYTDRIVITSLFNDTKKLLTTMIKQHISDDIDKHLLKLVQQGEMSLKQNRHFDIFIITPDKLMPSKDFLGTMAQEKKEGQQQQQQEEEQEELYQLSDSIHYKKLVNGLNQKFNSQLSYLLIIQDQQKNKITCVSSVQPQAIEKGVTANEWIECLMKRFDGKGGGRNNLANGSLNYNSEVNPLQLDEVISNAQELLEQYELKMKQEGEE